MGVYEFVLDGGDGGVWPSISPIGGLLEGYDATSWKFLTEGAKNASEDGFFNVRMDWQAWRLRQRCFDF